MHIEISWGKGIPHSDSLHAHITEQVEHALRHMAEEFTRVQVHLHDDNAAKGGSNDKRCVMEARPTGADPLTVDATGDDFYVTVTATAKKLERAARSFSDKRRSH